MSSLDSFHQAREILSLELPLPYLLANGGHSGNYHPYFPLEELIFRNSPLLGFPYYLLSNQIITSNSNCFKFLF